MIYFDNSATTLTKPPEVAAATADAVNRFGNAGRSFYEPVLLANREIFKTRLEIASLVGLDEPLNIAFTSGATESLNLVIGALARREGTVITTVTEHNSVLRPLYLREFDLRLIDCDDDGNFSPAAFEQMLTPPVKFFICTHGSNVTGNITPAKKFHDICQAHKIIMILDVAQTLGTIPVTADMADIFCFTGHKGLFGPQGTGGVIVSGNLDLDIVKTGGAGHNSFTRLQSADMPDIFEAGTLNGHGLYGLQQGVRFINQTGVKTIQAHEAHLTKIFYDGIKNLAGLKIYGDFASEERLPVISLNIAGLTSAELAELLWMQYGIATRAGSHCAPLLHERFGTVDVGMVRFSFSYFNTEAEIHQAVAALTNITKSLDR